MSIENLTFFVDLKHTHPLAVKLRKHVETCYLIHDSEYIKTPLASYIRSYKR